MIARGERLAAIDVGSNTILLTVAEGDPRSGLIVIEDDEDQARLGAGLAETGRLSEPAIRRALVALTQMRETCRRLGAERISAVATAAVREAANGAEFVERVRALDIPLRVISPEAEAALSYRSAAYRFPGSGRRLVADIGGGSLELIGATGALVSLTQSLPLGAVRLTELGLTLAPLRQHIGLLLEKTLQELWAGATIIGSGGTFSTLGSMVLAQRGRAGQPVHGVTVTAGEVARLLVTLAEASPGERRRMPGLKPERADIIVAGLAVVAELLKRVEVEQVTVSGFGLRDGMLLELAGIK